MNFLLMCAAVVLPFRKKEESPLTKELYKRIEKICRKVNGGDSGAKQLKYEALFDAVIHKLMAENFKALRQCKDDPPSNSWLITIIRRLSIDQFRKEFGRVNKSDLDHQSKMICKLAFQYDYPPDEIRALLMSLPDYVEISIEEIEQIIEAHRLKPVKKSGKDDEIEIVSLFDEETQMSEHIHIDKNDPDKVLSKGGEIRDEQIAIELFLQRLTPVQRLMISMFFGLSGEKHTLKEIVDILFCLGIETTETALQKQKGRAIDDFKEWLGKQKLSLDDLIVRQVARSAS